MTINTPETLELLQVADLRTYDRNARTHSADQIAQLVHNIRNFGWTNPIIVDEANQIIAGHGRLAAAKQLGMDTVPCIRVSGLSDIEKKALVLSDNKIALNAGWDDKLLAEELQAIQFAIDAGDLDFKIDEVLGFAMAEVDRIMEVLAEPEPEPPVNESFALHALADRLVEVQSGRVRAWGYDGVPLGDHPFSGFLRGSLEGESVLLSTDSFSRNGGATWRPLAPGATVPDPDLQQTLRLY